MNPRALVLRAPGTNCDEETAEAWRLAGADAEVWHVGQLLESPKTLASFQILTIPGGFSYGDDLGAGAIFARRMGAALADAIASLHDRGGLVVGVCNGFQVLVRAGLLPGGDPPRKATLAHNNTGRYEARWVRLKASPGLCPFVDGETVLELPVAHGEGKFLTEDASLLEQLVESRQVFLQYVDLANKPTGDFPANPNGSPLGIAGVASPSGRIFGLMPHPERFVSRVHHPRWTRLETADDAIPDGLRLFKNAVRSLK